MLITIGKTNLADFSFLWAKNNFTNLPHIFTLTAHIYIFLCSMFPYIQYSMIAIIPRTTTGPVNAALFLKNSTHPF